MEVSAAPAELRRRGEHVLIAHRKNHAVDQVARALVVHDSARSELRDREEARPLKVGDESAALTVITDGLKDGEQVVVNNQYRLQPGARIRVSPPAEAAKAVVARPKEDS